MASNLRKRLTKRAATPDIKGTRSDKVGSGNLSTEDFPPKQVSDKNDKPIARGDLSGTPPSSEPKRISHSDKSEWSESPSQSLLFRYKNRIAANHHIMTTKLPSAINAHTTSRDAICREQVVSDQPPVTADSLQTPLKYGSEPIGVTRVYDGVHFEMMSAQKPDAAFTGKAPNQALPYERRQTRSQTRRQQRIDSHKAPLESSAGNEGHNLTIRKVHDAERTPSPIANKYENDVTDADLVTPTSANPNYSPQDRLALSSPTATDSVKSEASPSLIDISSEGVISTPKVGSYHRGQQEKVPQDAIPPVLVKPPPFNAQVPAGFLWVSHFSSSSRPSEPWGWLKKWTCCQCAVLDPNGHGLPAETMVEQKICSRLECGHERCPLGCKILRD